MLQALLGICNIHVLHTSTPLILLRCVFGPFFQAFPTFDSNFCTALTSWIQHNCANILVCFLSTFAILYQFHRFFVVHILKENIASISRQTLRTRIVSYATFLGEIIKICRKSEMQKMKIKMKNEYDTKRKMRKRFFLYHTHFPLNFDGKG